jgi:hypothetical protein
MTFLAGGSEMGRELRVHDGLIGSPNETCLVSF